MFMLIHRSFRGALWCARRVAPRAKAGVAEAAEWPWSSRAPNAASLSTALIEDLDPEDAELRLRPALDRDIADENTS
jgi:hypothetical protein